MEGGEAVGGGGVGEVARGEDGGDVRRVPHRRGPALVGALGRLVVELGATAPQQDAQLAA